MRQSKDTFADPRQARAIQKIVSDFLKSNKRPESVKLADFSIDYGEDWSGDPGVWISLLIDDESRPSSGKISELNEFAKLILNAIIDANLGFWPYLQYVTPEGKRYRP